MFATVISFFVGLVSGIVLLFLYYMIRKKQLSHMKAKASALFKQAKAQAEEERKRSLLSIKD